MQTEQREDEEAAPDDRALFATPGSAPHLHENDTNDDRSCCGNDPHESGDAAFDQQFEQVIMGMVHELASGDVQVLVRGKDLHEGPEAGPRWPMLVHRQYDI